MNPIVEHLGKAIIARNKGDEYEEGMHLEMAMEWGSDLSTDELMSMQHHAISLIYAGEIK